MANGVSTRNKRFEFVNGWMTGGTDPADGSVECGEFTEYPLEITGASISDKIDKLAEIHYRVKYAAFTDNTLAMPSIAGGVIAGNMSPRVQYDTSSGGLNYNALMNGYWSLDETGFPCRAGSLTYHGSQYSSNTSAGCFSPAHGPFNFRDINTKEPGIWYPSIDDTESPLWNYIDENPYSGIGGYDDLGSLDGFYYLNKQFFRNAFFWYSISDAGTLTAPGIAVPYITDTSQLPDIVYESLEVLVQFSGRIAIVGDLTNLFDPDNRFFIGMKCRFNVAPFIYSATTGPIEAGFSSRDAEYVMRLSSGDISCKFNSDVAVTGELVHEAVEWWPYAKDNPAVPVWDTDNGAKL